MPDRQHAPALPVPTRTTTRTADRSVRVLVCVCTRRRPRMLRRCMRSIADQALPKGAVAEILVVENDAEPGLRGLVEEVGTTASLPVHYCQEPIAGIPRARNRALEEASKRGFQWLVFIDDDEVAQPECLVELIAAARARGAEVVQGAVLYRYPEGDRWGPLLDPRRGDRDEGRSLHSAATGNSMIAVRLFAPDGLALRFDESMAFTGGSDTDFFDRARSAGVEIVYAARAVVHEEAGRERSGLGWLFRRQVRTRAAAVLIDRKNLGVAPANRKHRKRCLESLLHSVGYLLLCAVALLRGADAFRRAFLKSWQKLGASWGTLLGLWGRPPRPYETTDGS